MAASNVLAHIKPKVWRGLIPKIVEGRFHLIARCACGAERVWQTKTVFDPDTAVGRVHAAGWKTGKVRCPDCARSGKPKGESQVPEIATTKPVLTPVPPKPVETSDAARMAKRLAMVAVEEAYDDVGKRYKPGHNDASIAKSLKMAEAAIAKLREEFFGPAGEPDELLALRKRLSAAEANCDTVLAEFTRKWEEAQKQVAGVVAELDRVALINGWRR